MFSWIRDHLPTLAHIATVVIAILSVVPLCAASSDLITESRFIQSLIGANVGDRGPCMPGQQIEVGEFCVFTPTESRFRVVESGASPPGEARLVTDRVKIDWDPSGHTFQATRLPDGDGAWRIDVAGLWRNAGSLDEFCHTGDTLEPGEFCTEPNYGHQFRVYATDELNAGDKMIRALCPTGEGDDCRPLYASGYAVLFQFVGNSDDLVNHVPNRRNGRLDGRRIRCVDPADNTMVLFEAERQAEEGMEASGDAWRIVTATQREHRSQDEHDALDCAPKDERTGS